MNTVCFGSRRGRLSDGWRRFKLAVSVGAVAAVWSVAGSLATAQTAAAAPITNGVNLRACVDLSNPVCANPVGTTGSGGMQKMRCWRDASWATGTYSSNRWFLVVLNDGREGYVHSSFVPYSSQQATPNCSTLAYVRAADWAIARIGQRVQPNGVGWSGYCATYTYNAFVQGAGTGYPAADAIGQYYHFRDTGAIVGGLPRYGDPVFYNIAPPFGHTSIYIGGTTIITTQGDEGTNQPIATRDIYSYANYLGWALV